MSHGGDEQVPVVVIAGTAGVGKTSFAIHLARQVSSRFPDGQLFVNLRGYDTGPPLEPTAVLERFLRALGVPGPALPSSPEGRAELYRSLLADKRMLVVLDNAASVGQARPLLPGATGCLTVVTSRNRLSGLSVRDGARRITLGMLDERESRELITRATRDYRTGDEPGQVAELARLCARLPLALRIAAERAATQPLLTLDELVTQLRDESSLWEALSSPDEEEADAVRSVFAWSYRALPPPAARLFRLLGLHPGPEFSVHVAAALCEQDLRQTRTLLEHLAGAHLVDAVGADRYQFHDLLRAYATAQAQQEESPEDRQAALRRVATWYLHAADAARAAAAPFQDSVLTPPPGAPAVPVLRTEQEAFAWHQREQANLLAAARSAAQAGLDEIAWQLAATLQGVHMARGVFDDWRAMGTIGLEAAQRLGDLRAEVLMHNTLGMAGKDSRNLVAAAEHHQAALDLCTRLGDHVGEAESANGLALVHRKSHHLELSRPLLERALELFERHGPRRWTGLVLCNLGFTVAELGELPEAARLARQGLAVYEETGAEPSWRIDALCLLTYVARESGAYEEAEEYLARAHALQKHSSFATIDAALHREEAALRLAQGERDAALEAYRACEVLERSIGNRVGQALAYDGIGRTLHALGRSSEAAEFHTVAARILRDPPHPWHLAETLAHLAEALTADGRSDEARPRRSEALELLAGFSDPQATALRRRLQEQAGGPHGG
ncbi:tetratricopeptide repeat protein [Streptomyces albidoflavus]